MQTDELEKQGFTPGEKLEETEYAVTYSAIQQSLNRTVQLRFLKPEFENNAAVVAYFLGVARLLARIKSDEVISVFDIISEPTCHCIILEDVAGSTLADSLREKGVLPRREALRIALSVCNGISLLWDRLHLVLHNLSPFSVHLLERGGAKITDFFQAEQADKGDGLATYIDMRSLGVLLKKMLSDTTHPLDADVETDVNRMMAEDPAACYPSWDAVAEDLKNLLAVTPQPAAEASSRIRVRRREVALPAAQKYQDKNILAEHTQQIQKERRFKEDILWLALVLWFGVLFWLRAYSPTEEVKEILAPIQNVKSEMKEAIADGLVKPPHEKKDEEEEFDSPWAEQAPATNTAAEPPKTNAIPQTNVAPQKTARAFLPPAAAKKLAAALAGQGLAAALETAEKELADSPLRANLHALFANAPSPQELVERNLEKFIGKTVSFEVGGKKREVLLRAVKKGVLSIEANGHGADLPLSKLSNEQLLNWMDAPQNPSEALVWCAELLHSPRKSEISTYAEQCPLLQSVLLDAAEIASSATP